MLRIARRSPSAKAEASGLERLGLCPHCRHRASPNWRSTTVDSLRLSRSDEHECPRHRATVAVPVAPTLRSRWSSTCALARHFGPDRQFVADIDRREELEPVRRDHRRALAGTARRQTTRRPAPSGRTASRRTRCHRDWRPPPSPSRGCRARGRAERQPSSPCRARSLSALHESQNGLNPSPTTNAIDTQAIGQIVARALRIAPRRAPGDEPRHRGAGEHVAEFGDGVPPDMRVYASMPSGFSTSALNACISSAPSAPSIAR